MLTNAQRYGADGAKALGLHPDIITREDYAALKAKAARFDAWYASVGSPRSYPSGSEPENVRMTNEERSAIEVYEFVTNPPARYFLYITRNPAFVPHAGHGNPETSIPGWATTWTGERLGIAFLGTLYRSNFGDRRIPVTVKAINGVTYHGTYYSDAGNYARIKAAKASKGVK